MIPAHAPDLDRALDAHRRELTGYCYRMLGSGFEAEDAVQETLLRAWRAVDRFDERRSTWRSWLFTIATNVCLDMLRGGQRRARAMDMGPAADGAPRFDRVVPKSAWVYPVADDRVVDEHGDPADVAIQRETIRLAFVAALQQLPPRQRAVLLLRDVLRWSTPEVAAMLGVSDAAINSTLQRARSTLAARRDEGTEPLRPDDPAEARLLRRYAEAFERHDIASLMSLLHEEATTSMPPIPWWLQGRAAIRRVMEAGDDCRHDRLVPTRANGTAAFGQYRPDDHGILRPFALVILEQRAGLVAATTTYLDLAASFPAFGLATMLTSDDFRPARPY